MKDIYDKHAEVYEAMYRSFMNYPAEYAYYHKILKKYKCKSLLELGCGTGNLASLLLQHPYQYIGLDNSESMLKRARKKLPQHLFIKSKMQKFTLPVKVDACIFTGRTSSYLKTNSDVKKTLDAINGNLETGGIVVFDVINAPLFIKKISNKKKSIHEAKYKGKHYYRESCWIYNPMQLWSFDWISVYYEKLKGGKKKKLFDENSTLRSFSKEDMQLFLELSGFKVLKITPKASYAFDTLVFIAQKIQA
jgi:SAM-dependent methyltransferase